MRPRGSMDKNRSRDLIVIGASTGGVRALEQLVADLPTGLRAAVLIVMHIGAEKSLLPGILRRAGPLPAAEAVDGELIEKGRIYLPASDRHLMSKVIE